MGQNHDGGHAQPSPPPSSPTYLKTLQMSKIHREPTMVGFFFNTEKNQTKSLRTSSHLYPSSWLGRPQNQPQNCLFLTFYFTLGINTTPVLHLLYPCNRESPPSSPVTPGLWHQKQRETKLKLLCLAIRHLRYLLLQRPHIPESSE